MGVCVGAGVSVGAGEGVGVNGTGLGLGIGDGTMIGVGGSATGGRGEEPKLHDASKNMVSGRRTTFRQ
jgi:hypothetical protein